MFGNGLITDCTLLYSIYFILVSKVLGVNFIQSSIIDNVHGRCILEIVKVRQRVPVPFCILGAIHLGLVIFH